MVLKKQQAFHKSHSKKRIIVVATVLLVLLACAGVGVYLYWNTRPNKVLADALVNATSDVFSQKPIKLLGSVKLSTTPNLGDELVISFTSFATNSSGETRAIIRLNYGGNSYETEALVRIVNEDELYIQLQDLQKVAAKLAQEQPEFKPYIASLTASFKTLDNKWLKISGDDFLQKEPRNQPINPCAKAFTATHISMKDKKQLKKLFKSNRFIFVAEVLNEETIADQKSYHYRLGFNNKAAKTYFNKAMKLESFSGIKNACGLDENRIEALFQENKPFSHTESAQTTPVVELWVGTKNRRPTKFQATGGDSKVVFDINSTIQFDSKSTAVKKPKNTVPFSELKSDFEKLFTTKRKQL